MGIFCSTRPSVEEEDELELQHSRSPQNQRSWQPQYPQVVLPRANHYLAPADPAPVLHVVQSFTTTTTSTVGPLPVIRPVARKQPTGHHHPRIASGVGRIANAKCEACGQPNHTKANCRYRTRLCFYCREEGHIISVCPAKKRQRQRSHEQRRRR